MVAPAVSVLRPVENRRRGVTGENVNHAPVHDDRHIPMTLGRQAHHLELLGRVPIVELRRSGVVRQQGPRHVDPPELLKRPNVGGENRIPRQQNHPELALEDPETERVVGLPEHAVVVEVETRIDPRVGGRHEDEGVIDRQRPVLRNAEIVLEEPANRSARRIEVKLVDEEYVGANALNDLRDDARLAAPGAGKLRPKLSRRASVQRRVEGRHPKGAGRTVIGPPGGRQQGHPHSAEDGTQNKDTMRAQIRHAQKPLPW